MRLGRRARRAASADLEMQGLTYISDVKSSTIPQGPEIMSPSRSSFSAFNPISILQWSTRTGAPVASPVSRTALAPHHSRYHESASNDMTCHVLDVSGCERQGKLGLRGRLTSLRIQACTSLRRGQKPVDPASIANGGVRKRCGRQHYICMSW